MNMKRLARVGAASLLAAPLLIAADAPGALAVDLSGVRNAKGKLLLCLSAAPKYFPDCSSDPAARTMVVPAAKAGRIVFDGVVAGTYALSIMHDENGNSKLDTTLGLPREGFGFSRNPVVRFGPPKFKDVRFTMPASAYSVPVKMKYFL